MDVTMNETHIRYMLTVPFDSDNNRLDVLFARLETLDPIERMRALGFTYSALGATYQGNGDSDAHEEAYCERAYASFKARCNELLASGVEDFLLVYTIVTNTLAMMRSRGDQHYAKDTVAKMKRAMAFFQQGMEQGDSEPATAENCMRMAEERANNALADAELDRERYERFCREVVTYLL
jgi:hypothetical protein